jgi:lipid-binding SYLF domain-containing protein
VILIPGLFKGAFLFGGKYGRGFASCRRPGGWSAPAFGSQLGGSATDLILLVLGRADLAVVEGIGYDASVNTGAFMGALMIYSLRSKGLFVGISLEGASLRSDKGENRKLYRPDIASQEILARRTAPPRGARPSVTALNHFARKRGKANRDRHA